MQRILKETVLEFRLTYFGERLFGASVLMAILKSLKLSAKCFVDLLTPCNENIFQQGGFYGLVCVCNGMVINCDGLHCRNLFYTFSMVLAGVFTTCLHKDYEWKRK